MKNTVKLPKTAKGWLSLLLLIFIVLIGIWPIIPLFNKPSIILGMPLLMLWSIVIIFSTTFSMVFIDKIGGSE